MSVQRLQARLPDHHDLHSAPTSQPEAASLNRALGWQRAARAHADSFTVEIHDSGKIYFELENFEIPCAPCGTPAFAPCRELLKMKYGEPKVFDCVDCGHPNRVMWILARADLPKDGSTTAKALDRPPQA